MHPLEGLANQAEWAGKNTAYNLKFIPDDKLGWKPAPTAKSALEIVNHVLYFVRGMTGILRGGKWAEPEMQPLTSRAQAQDLLTTGTRDYAAALRQVNPADLGKTVELPFGSFEFARAASMPVLDLIHHHGQIAYIQTLLGDEEMHFYEMGE